MNLIARAHDFVDRYAVISNDRAYTYQELLTASEQIAQLLLDGRKDLGEIRVAMMVEPGFDYVGVQWGIWRAGGIAVPLALSYPLAELQYVIETAGCEVIVADQKYIDLLKDLARTHGIPLISTGELLGLTKGELPRVHSGRSAMILFTSGTTSKPKGVVITHANIEAQVKSLSEAWAWQADDHILNVLPLHHVHGITNVLCCALWNGALCEFLPKFDEADTWNRLSSGELTLFMAVPTIYARLIRYWEAQAPFRQSTLSANCRKMRLMVSGSAALPVSVLEKWEAITHQRLLERYGMTEIGMALSNPYQGERRPGHVGLPLPGVEIRLVNSRYQDVPDGEQGEVLVRGAGVFFGYWDREDATAEAFMDGWFRTGDMAVLQNGYYRILGRASVDILKSGGYKLSALEIEEVFRRHPGLGDVAVVGLDDEEWGQVVAMAAIRVDDTVTRGDLLNWGQEFLAPYKMPRKVVFVDDLPRNVLGKVLKVEVKGLFK